MSEELFGGADPTEAELPQEPVAEAPVVEVLPPVEVAPEPEPPPKRPPSPLPIGESVFYVMPDGTDRTALLMAVNDGDLAILNAQVALAADDRIQKQQFAGVPYGTAGEPETWREVSR